MFTVAFIRVDCDFQTEYIDESSREAAESFGY